jgi:tetratricopeptide (TPR) repeat protein
MLRIASVLVVLLFLCSCRSAFALDSEHPAGYDDAMRLYAARKYAPASAKFAAIAKEGTADADTHLYLGACYQALKKYDAALEQYDWVAKNAPLISLKNKGRSSAAWIRSARAGICPGNCLKANDPRWQRDATTNLSWIKFPYTASNGNHAWHSWSTHHIGQIIETVNGVPTNKGVCPICGGTGRVPKLK